MSDTAEPVTPAAPVAAGFYNLTADVVNPKPDRRSGSLAARGVWPKGTLVQFIPADVGGASGHVYFKDNSCVLYGGGGKHRTTAFRRQGDPLAAHLAPAGETIGVQMATSNYSPSDVLAVFVERGVLTARQVVECLEWAAELSHEDLMAMRQRHNL